MLITVGRYIDTKHWGILYVQHCGKIYLDTILRNTVCSTLGRFIYTKYWGILYVEHCGKIYLHKILYVEHCGKIYLHKILRNTVCWTLWEDLFTQNSEEYCTLKTVRRFIYTKYWGILYVEHYEKIYLQKILRNTLCWTLWEDLFTQILRNTVRWTLWEDLFTQNTVRWTLWEDLFTQNSEEYCMLKTVRRFIYRKYWGILYVEHYEKIYLHKILGTTLCWALLGDLFTQNTGDYLKLNTGNININYGLTPCA